MRQIGPFSSYHLDKIIIGQPGMIELKRERKGERNFQSFQEYKEMVRDHRWRRPDPVPRKKVD